MPISGLTWSILHACVQTSLRINQLFDVIAASLGSSTFSMENLLFPLPSGRGILTAEDKPCKHRTFSLLALACNPRGRLWISTLIPRQSLSRCACVWEEHEEACTRALNAESCARPMISKRCDGVTWISSNIIAI